MSKFPRVPKYSDYGVRMLAGLILLIVCVCFVVGAIAFAAAFAVAWYLQG